MNDTSPSPVPPRSTSLHLTLDWRIVVLALLAVIIGMLYFWKPWESVTPKKTITVQGEATVQAPPDTYAFRPVFEDTDLPKVTATGNAAVAQLKKLGVKDADIKTTVSGSTGTPQIYAKSTLYPVPVQSADSYVIIATVHDKALAQKVSDYLATTTATGETTPTASFSKATTTNLNLQARSQAADDAKTKADVTAGQLGVHVGHVVSISDTGSGFATPLTATSGGAAGSSVADGPTIQPGTDEVSYSFTVVFELK